jgi:hypothetical protein
MLILEDPSDLAKAASVAASGRSNGKCGSTLGQRELEAGAFADMPGSPDGMEVQLLVTAEKDSLIKGAWHDSSLPSRRLLGKKAGTFDVWPKRALPNGYPWPLPQPKDFSPFRLSLRPDSLFTWESASVPGYCLETQRAQNTSILA